MTRSKPWYLNPWLHAALICAVAAAFRLWQLDRFPPGLFGDEATDGLDALDVLAGRGAIFFPANFGREGLHMWLVAGMFRLLGVTPLALRLPSAIAGVVTALATFWLGHELLAVAPQRAAHLRRRPKGAEQGASVGFDHAMPLAFLPLLAALYLATSYWHIHFSRFGIRGVFTPLLAALAFAAFWRGVNHRAPAWFAFSGACLGLATHFYTASRFLPVFLGGFLLVEWGVAACQRRGRQALLWQHLGPIVVLFAVAALVFAPLGLYFLQHPGSFTQRAGEVAAFGTEDAWLRMGRAALANVLQFVAPNAGDQEQFYNLPGRAVFDPLSALLALLGLGLLLWRWRQPSALFLLLWFPALLLPSFLATDRWPTLPRVLGVIPGVYFFPALGLCGVAAAVMRLPRRGAAQTMAALALLLAPGWHAARAYHDYFQVWAASNTTFDAFEGDMTAAWRWLAANDPVGHIYLSTDLYRHPTFMLLHEHGTVQTFWSHTNPDLSWFDGRLALPWPPAGETATYLIARSAPLPREQLAALTDAGREVDRVLGPDGLPAITIYEVTRPATPAPSNTNSPQPFTEKLTLTSAQLRQGAAGGYELWLRWETAGPDALLHAGYRLQIEAKDPGQGPAEAWQTTVALDAYRPPEWVAGGAFVSWHPLEGLGGPPRTQLNLRLIDVTHDAAVIGADAPEGWRRITMQP